MFRFSLLFAALLTSTSAMAGSVEYDFRFDSRGTTWNSDATGSKNFENGYRMMLNTGRLDWRGKLSDTVDYRLRWRFDRPQIAKVTGTTPSNNTRDVMANFIDFAYVTNKLSDNISFTGGKFHVEMGGWEAQTPSPDLYTFSEAFSDKSAAAGMGVATTATTVMSIANNVYQAGFKITGKFDTNEVMISHTNLATDSVTLATSATTEANTMNQGKGMTGIVYKGQFGPWKPILSYHVADAANSAINGKYTFIGFGNRLTFGDLGAEIEYLSNGYKDDNQEEKLPSIIALVNYQMGQWKPQLKYTTTNKTITNASGATGKGVVVNTASLAIEYKPKTEENFRYHLAYVMNTYTPDSNTAFSTANGVATSPTAGTAYTNNEIIFGIRMMGDFLK